MELLDIELTEFTRRSGSVVVAHSDAELDRGLDAGEAVVVRTETGEFIQAWVADIDFDLDDTYYRLRLEESVRLDAAHERLSGALLSTRGAAALLALIDAAPHTEVAPLRAVHRA